MGVRWINCRQPAHPWHRCHGSTRPISMAVCGLLSAVHLFGAGSLIFPYFAEGERLAMVVRFRLQPFDQIFRASQRWIMMTGVSDRRRIAADFPGRPSWHHDVENDEVIGVAMKLASASSPLPTTVTTWPLASSDIRTRLQGARSAMRMRGGRESRVEESICSYLSGAGLLFDQQPVEVS